MQGGSLESESRLQDSPYHAGPEQGTSLGQSQSEGTLGRGRCHPPPPQRPVVGIATAACNSPVLVARPRQAPPGPTRPCQALPCPTRPRQAPPGPTRPRQALGTSLWAQAPSTPSRPLQHSRGRPISPAMALARLPSWTPEGACAEGLVAGGAAGGTQGHEWGLAGLFTFF